MPAYSKPINPYACASCGKKAMMEVFTTYNSSCGFYCTTCATREVERRNREQERIINAARCPAHMPDFFPPGERGRCGLPAGHGGAHTLLIPTGAPWLRGGAPREDER